MATACEWIHVMQRPDNPLLWTDGIKKDSEIDQPGDPMKIVNFGTRQRVDKVLRRWGPIVRKEIPIGSPR
jgi:hypothetical protein